jgi:hypothetical protein
MQQLNEVDLVKYILRLAKDPHLDPLNQIKYSERIADMRKLLAFKKHQ